MKLDKYLDKRRIWRKEIIKALDINFYHRHTVRVKNWFWNTQDKTIKKYKKLLKYYGYDVSIEEIESLINNK